MCVLLCHTRTPTHEVFQRFWNNDQWLGIFLNLNKITITKHNYKYIVCREGKIHSARKLAFSLIWHERRWKKALRETEAHVVTHLEMSHASRQLLVVKKYNFRKKKC